MITVEALHIAPVKSLGLVQPDTVGVVGVLTIRMAGEWGWIPMTHLMAHHIPDLCRKMEDSAVSAGRHIPQHCIPNVLLLAHRG